MIVYDLFPLLAGPFPEWPPHIERAAALGFDWLFVNPVQRPGGSGSIYSVADYFELNPALVGPHDPRSAEEQLGAALAQARARGMRTMTDLVINHCAADSPLVRAHPEWLVHDDDGVVAHPSYHADGQTFEWADLAQFDHRRTRDPEGLYAYFRAVVRHLFGLGFDGFRCDTAYGVPPELWRRLIADIKASHPDAVLVAETLGCSPWATLATAGAGFDYVFNSAKWWDFRSPWLLEQGELIGQRVATIGFAESHDTPVQSDRPFVDVSPELHMDFVAVAPFSYLLAPGQGVVLVTSVVGF